VKNNRQAKILLVVLGFIAIWFTVNIYLVAASKDCPLTLLDYEIATHDATDISTDSAILNGCIDPGSNGTWEAFFKYGTNEGGPYPFETDSENFTSSFYYCEPLLKTVHGLLPNTTYYYHIETVDGCQRTFYDKSFTTLCTETSQYVSTSGEVMFPCNVGAHIEFTGVSNPGTITITVHTDESYPSATGDSVKRWYAIDSTVSGTFNLILSYADRELSGEEEENLKLWRRADGVWDSDGPYGTVDTESNQITAVGLTEFSDWIIADEQGPQPPVPEIITIVLICLGFFAIAGLLHYRRKAVTT